MGWPAPTITREDGERVTNPEWIAARKRAHQRCPKHLQTSLSPKLNSFVGKTEIKHYQLDTSDTVGKYLGV